MTVFAGVVPGPYGLLGRLEHDPVFLQYPGGVGTPRSVIDLAVVVADKSFPQLSGQALVSPLPGRSCGGLRPEPTPGRSRLGFKAG